MTFCTIQFLSKNVCIFAQKFILLIIISTNNQSQPDIMSAAPVVGMRNFLMQCSIPSGKIGTDADFSRAATRMSPPDDHDLINTPTRIALENFAFPLQAQQTLYLTGSSSFTSPSQSQHKKTSEPAKHRLPPRHILFIPNLFN